MQDKRPETTENEVRRRYRKSAVTRERVYHSALALMGERGYQGTTIREVCERAGVSVGTFYSYFDSKIDILRDIYASGDLYFTETVARELAELDPVARLYHYADCYARLNEDTGLDMMKVLFNAENQWFTRRRPMQQLLADVIATGQTQGVFRSDLSCDELVAGIFDLLRGVCFAWCLFDGGFDLRAHTRAQIALLLGGLGTEKVEPVQ